MPNRLIKESICTSDSVDGLSWFEEVFFYRLIVNCDDYGRTDARPKILKSRLFPLKSDIREDLIVTTLYRLSLAGIVQVYINDERPYLQLRTWGKHQQIRNKKSKYPDLIDSFVINFSGIEKKIITISDFETICNQLISNDFKCSRNPIQSESKDMNTSYSCSEQGSKPEETKLDKPETENSEDLVVITITTNTGEEYPVTQSMVDYWKSLYPSVNIIIELKKMKGWADANQKKRKTSGGMKRFINAWLAKEQNSYHPKQFATASNSFNNFQQNDYDFEHIEKILTRS